MRLEDWELKNTLEEYINLDAEVSVKDVTGNVEFEWALRGGAIGSPLPQCNVHFRGKRCGIKKRIGIILDAYGDTLSQTVTVFISCTRPHGSTLRFHPLPLPPPDPDAQ